ncbi:MAG: PH domain-containing protein, partial [Lysobacterales bacterium]
EGVGHLVDSAAVEGDAPEVLHALGLGELVRLGISSDRGLVALAALWAASWQFDFDFRDMPLVSQLLGGAQRAAWGFVGDHGAISVALAAIVMLALLWILLRALSVVIAIVSFYGFRLERHGRRIISEAGLLTRTRAGATPNRIQRVTVRQSWLLKRMRRVSVQVTLAGGSSQGNEKETRLRWLAPIATVADAQRILAGVRPDADWLRDDWRPLHPRAAWRMFKWPALFVVLGVSALGLVNPLFLWAWLVLPWLWIEARGRAKFGGYAMDGETFAVRAGWLGRSWDSVRLRDIQSVRFRQTPGDRRQGMARVAAASAGSSDLVGSPVEVACLAADEASALCDRLREVASRAGAELGVAALL